MLSTAFCIALASASAAEQPAAVPPPSAIQRSPSADTAPRSLQPYRDGLVETFTVHPGGLTADVVAREAVVSSPSVEVKRAELRATAAELDRTLTRYVPSVSATASYTRNSEVDINFGGGGAVVGALNEGPIAVVPCPDGSGNQCAVDSGGVPLMAASFAPIDVPLNNYSLVGSLSVPFSDYALRMMPAKRGSEVEIHAAELRRDAEAIQVELNARLAYYDWLRGLAQVTLTRRSLDDVKARLQDGRAGLAAGILSSTDVMRLEGTLSTAEVAVLLAESFERLARRQLAVIMGRDEIDFDVGEDLFSPADSLESWGSPEALVREGQTQRLEIRALTESSQALRYAMRATKADYIPRLAGFADYTYANPNQRFFPATDEWNASWYVGVSLSWQLGQFLDARLVAKKFGADRQQLEAQVVAMRRAVELEVNAAWEELARAHGALPLNQRSSEVAAAVYEQQVALYRAGETTTTDVLQAELGRLQATLREINDRIDLRVAHAKLLRASGRMLPQNREADPKSDGGAK